MRIFLSITVLLLSLTGVGAQINYYKQVKVVVGQQDKSGDNSGQFITINSKGCYDSDRSGNTVGNGFLQYQKTDKGMHIYFGKSFWGNAYYYFSSDYSRLNVKPTQGETVYVYSKSQPQSGILTSSLIKPEVEPPVGKEVPTVIIIPDNNPMGVTGNTGSATSDYSTSKLVNVTCSFCTGTGNNPNPNYTTNYTGYNQYQYCGICKRTMDPHTHGKCPSCNGRGYTQRRQ